MQKSLIERYKQEAVTTLTIGWPIVIGQLGLMAMAVTDTIQVGGIPERGTASVAAAGVANSLFFTIAVISLIALGVIAPMISKADAEGEVGEVNHLFRAALKAAVILSIATVFLTFGSLFFLDKLGQEPEIVALTKPFAMLMAVSGIPLFIFVAIRQLSDGLGKTRVAMVVTVSAVFLNVFLNWLLINGIGFLPRLELVGSGIATLISRIYMMAALWFSVKNDGYFSKYLKNSGGHLNELVKNLLKTGLPAGLQGFFEVAVFAGAVIIIGWRGKSEQAAHLIALNICSVTYMMASGIATAGGIRVGHFWGLKDKAQMRISGNTALGLAGTFMVACGILLFIFNHWLVCLYTKEPDVIPITMTLLIIGGFFQLWDGLQVTALGILRGIADVNVPTVITLFAYWIVGLPFGYFLSSKYDMKAAGVWYGLTLGLAVSAILLCWRFYSTLKTMRFEEENELIKSPSENQF